MDIAVITMTIATAVASLHDPVFGTEAGLNFSRDLLWSNRYGSFDRTERAAFIIDRGNGEIDCVAWPMTNERERATFHGTVPAGTIAIIHTHPINSPWPSKQDEREAHRLGIAIYVLTPFAVTKAIPSEAEPLVVRNGPWLDPVQHGYRCKLR
jgi:Prokaryotic homologs of the JAB domain